MEMLTTDSKLYLFSLFKKLLLAAVITLTVYNAASSLFNSRLNKCCNWCLTSAGFFWLEAGVPGLLPYLFEEQKEVEGPEGRQNLKILFKHIVVFN